MTTVEFYNMPDEPKKAELKWCSHCGEGVTDFCRGKTGACPYGFAFATPKKADERGSAEPIGQVYAVPSPTASRSDAIAIVMGSHPDSAQARDAVKLPEPDFALDGGATPCYYQSTLLALVGVEVLPKQDKEKNHV